MPSRRCPNDATPPRRDTLYNGVEQGDDENFRELATQVTIYGQPHLDDHTQLDVGEGRFDQNHRHFAQILLLGGACCSVLCLSTAGSHASIWQPFYITLAKLKDYSLTRRTQPELGQTSILEFKELNQAVDKMTRKIQDDFDSLKQFTENASHEIQTPLAIIKSKLEVMIQDEALSGEQMRSLQTIYEATGRLSRLNQALLLLTKIENDQFAATERLNLNVLVGETLGLFEDFIQAKNLQTETHLTDCWLDLNPSLARALLTNLIGNAIKHSAENGTLSLALTEKDMVIANPGAAPSQAPEAFFERFNKANPRADSLGLGLAIVKEICEYSGFKVRYEFIKGNHVVTVGF